MSLLALCICMFWFSIYRNGDVSCDIYRYPSPPSRSICLKRSDDFKKKISKKKYVDFVNTISHSYLHCFLNTIRGYFTRKMIFHLQSDGDCCPRLRIVEYFSVWHFDDVPIIFVFTVQRSIYTHNSFFVFVLLLSRSTPLFHNIGWLWRLISSVILHVLKRVDFFFLLIKHIAMCILAILMLFSKRAISFLIVRVHSNDNCSRLFILK